MDTMGAIARAMDTMGSIARGGKLGHALEPVHGM